MLSDLDMKKPLNESMICEEHVTPRVAKRFKDGGNASVREYKDTS